MNTKEKNILRIVLYILGLNLTALGLILNTKSSFGSSPIVSVSYTISLLTDTISYSNLTFVLYLIMIIVELLLNKKNNMSIISILLQIPVSFLMTRLMSFYDSLFDLSHSSLVIRIIDLVLAIIIIGVGAALTLSLNLVPNPGDGFVDAIAKYTGLSLSLTKNIIDISFTSVSLLLGLIFRKEIIGVGIGTIFAMIFVGRVIAIFNKLFLDRLKKLS